MKNLAFTSFATLMLAACTQELGTAPATGDMTAKSETAAASEVEVPAPSAKATSATSVGTKETQGGEVNPYAEGEPGQPAIPETREDPNWTSRYSPDIPYYNRSGSAIPATLGASPRTALVGQVQPGEGGFIKTCELNSTYCKITFGGNGKEGYVNMDLMAGDAR